MRVKYSFPAESLSHSEACGSRVSRRTEAAGAVEIDSVWSLKRSALSFTLFLLAMSNTHASDCEMFSSPGIA